MPLITQTSTVLKTSVSTVTYDQRDSPSTASLQRNLTVVIANGGVTIHVPESTEALFIAEGDLRALLKAVYPGE